MADVSNRDEADKCKEIARKALAAGDAEKALRFFQKAKRMCPGDGSIDALIAEAEATPAGGSGAPGGGDPAAAPEGPRQRPSASSGAGAAGAARAGKDMPYTADQMALVQRVLRTKDYFEVLQVDRNANEDAVKKAYKKLALKLHPDKNRAPGAEEAFKKLSKVVQCLTDEESRDSYRRYGDEDRAPQRQHRQHHGQDVFTPEDIFNMMFGIPPRQREQRAQRRPAQGEQPEGPNQQMIFQLMVCTFIFLPLLSSLVGRESAPTFSWARTERYRVKQTTATLRVPYFVTKDFGESYADGSPRLADFEHSVDVYHVRELRNECENSKQEMYRLVHQAKRRGSKKDVEAARKHPRPHCTKLDKIQSKHSRLYQIAMFGGIR